MSILYKRLRTFSILLCTLSVSDMLQAQSTVGLVAYYSFDGCDATDDTGGGANGVITGTADCDCGVSGNAFRFDGNTSIQILGNPDLLFNADFTISFYIRPEPQGTNTMNILSKSELCNVDSTAELRYNPNNREIHLTVAQHPNSIIRTAGRLRDDRCFHHVAFVRRDREMLLYYDGVQIALSPSATLVSMLNNAIFTLAGSPCLANGDVRFRGVLDELRMYNRALSSGEVEELYLPVDKITSPDTVLFTGTSMQVRLPITCATSIQWSPITGVVSPNEAEPIITPPATGTYQVSLNYGTCIANDTIHITVADSSELDCNNIFFATGFTPNQDGVNDTWGLSNVVFLGEFISLQVYDRWGGEVFASTRLEDWWDGSLQGEELMPGSYVYVFQYRCGEEEMKKAGNVVLIR